MAGQSPGLGKASQDRGHLTGVLKNDPVFASIPTLATTPILQSILEYIRFSQIHPTLNQDSQ